MDMAKIEYAAKSADFAARKEKTALEVSRIYLMTSVANEYVRVSQKAVEDAREHLRIAKLRYANGLGLYSDTLRAETALTSARQGLTSAEKNQAVAKRALGLMLGKSGPVEVVDESLDLPTRELEQHMATARARKDIGSLKLRHENAGNNLRLARAGALPTVGVGSSYQFNDHRRIAGTEGESWQIMGFLKWELFDGNSRGHERAKAQYQLAEAAEYLDGFKEAVSFKVHEAFLVVDESRLNSELARSALKTAEEGRRLVMVRYENSLSPLVDLLDAQANLDRARANMIAMQKKNLLALLTLGYESGTILDDLGIKTVLEEGR